VLVHFDLPDHSIFVIFQVKANFGDSESALLVEQELTGGWHKFRIGLRNDEHFAEESWLLSAPLVCAHQTLLL
jgi:hypothetical protein